MEPLYPSKIFIIEDKPLASGAPENAQSSEVADNANQLEALKNRMESVLSHYKAKMAHLES